MDPKARATFMGFHMHRWKAGGICRSPAPQDQTGLSSEVDTFFGARGFGTGPWCSRALMQMGFGEQQVAITLRTCIQRQGASDMAASGELSNWKAVHRHFNH